MRYFASSSASRRYSASRCSTTGTRPSTSARLPTRPRSWTPRGNEHSRRSCLRRPPRTKPRSRSEGDQAVTVSAERHWPAGPRLPAGPRSAAAGRPRLILPGLIPADPRVERFRVHPGAVTALELDAGDEITVIDAAGRQRGELTVLGSDGEDYAALAASADAAATVLRALATVGADAGRADAGAAAVVHALSERGLDPVGARAVGLFGDWSPAGATAAFTALKPVTCVVAAPDGLMSVDQDNPPSDLAVEIRRARPGQPREPRLPPPLADPLLDLRVDKATAIAYQVEAGQYIQVIDVEGRQCSDFLAFDSRQLTEGVERGLDATTTRNLTGNAYPQPGLFGKFFDQDMR